MKREYSCENTESRGVRPGEVGCEGLACQTLTPSIRPQKSVVASVVEGRLDGDLTRLDCFSFRQGERQHTV